MAVSTPGRGALARWDAWLLARPWGVRALVLGLTLAFAVVVRLSYVPASYHDFGRLNRGVDYGCDYYSDTYGARTVYNHPADMYTRRLTEQTRPETYWPKRSVAPYPPAELFLLAGAHALGAATGVGLYGVLIGMDFLLMALMLGYALKVRWYLFPLLYTNVFLAYRFWGIGSLNGLLVVFFLMLGLLLARSRPNAAILSAVFAVCLKLTPVFFLVNFLRFRQRTQLFAAALLVTGFVVPFFALENYRYIYGFHATRDIGPIVRALGALGVGGPRAATLAAVVGWVLPLAVGGAFSLVLLYAQYKLDFTWEDRIGWAAAPFALLFSLRMLSMRTLFEAMVLPDRRHARSLWIFAMGLVDIALRLSGARTVVRDGIWDACGLLGLLLICRHWLGAIGMQEIRADLARGVRLLPALLRAPARQSPADA
jgi:hypothetical protein